MSYESDIASGAFVPSERAKEVDALIAASTPETEPENWKFLGTVGWVYVGPLGKESSRSEYTAWVNRDLGAFTHIYDQPDADSTNNNQAEEKPIGWYWTGTAWLPFYQGEGAPASAIVASTSTQPSGPPAGWVDPNSTNNTNNSTETTPVKTVVGWMWNPETGEWEEVYQDTDIPPGAIVAPTSTKPTTPPTTNNGNTNNTNSNTTPNPEPEPPLYTPTADQFYGGLFTAFDLLNRDGGEIKSPFYKSAREKVLQSLADQAASQGRTQNTAEEIAMAQRSAPSLSASGLFGPNAYALSSELFNA